MEYIAHSGAYIAHYGIQGQKWGVRRFQNEDGSLTEVGKKRYRTDLRADTKIRKNLELRAYDSGKVASLYASKQKQIEKKYEKALRNDPNKEKDKTNRLETTKKALEISASASKASNDANISALKQHVESMARKYQNTKIKSVNQTTMKNGTDFAYSTYTAWHNANVTYDLRENRLKDANGKTIGSFYTPTKTYHY